MPSKGKGYEKAGQPTKYKPEFCDLLVQHLSSGYSFESFGAIADVCESTIYNWCDPKHPSYQEEFLEAKKRAWPKCRYWWESQGIKGLWSKEFNTGVYSLEMKNRFKYRSEPKDDVKQDDKQLESFEFNNVDPEGV